MAAAMRLTLCKVCQNDYLLSRIWQPIQIACNKRARLQEIVQVQSCFGIQQQLRYTSFFTKIKADQLWKGVVSVSNAGKKRGRGKGMGKKTSKNLNKGQVIGIGQSNMVWPGLNAPVLKGKEIVERRQLPPDPERESKLIKLRDEMSAFRVLRLDPLERGWSGTKMPGRSIGPPDPIGEDTFEGFDTKVLEFKTVTNMSGVAGRKKRYSAFVVTGNKNGLAGYALSKSPDNRASLKKAKNSAAQKLIYIELFNGHTVYHNFYARYGKTKIFVRKSPKGYGLICHRAIRTICEIIGIKDLYAKVEGNTKNIKNLTKAFFLGLTNQQTHQQLADKTGLHIIEMSKGNDYFPKVVASPQISSSGSTDKKIDYREYISEGRVELIKKKHPPFFVGTKGWELHLKKTVFRRNHVNLKVQVLAEYGKLKSHLNDLEEEKLPKKIGVAPP